MSRGYPVEWTTLVGRAFQSGQIVEVCFVKGEKFRTTFRYCLIPYEVREGVNEAKKLSQAIRPTLSDALSSLISK